MFCRIKQYLVFLGNRYFIRYSVRQYYVEIFVLLNQDETVKHKRTYRQPALQKALREWPDMCCTGTNVVSEEFLLSCAVILILFKTPALTVELKSVTMSLNSF